MEGCALRCSIPTVNTRADHTSYTLSLEAVGGPQAAWTVEKVRAMDDNVRLATGFES